MKEAKNIYSLIDNMPVVILEPSNLRRRAREIAEKYNQRTVYDSLYAALAELQECDFWTADKKFYKAVNKELKFVKLLEDYQ